MGEEIELAGTKGGGNHSAQGKKKNACKSIHECIDTKLKKNQRTPLYIFYAFAVGVSWAATFSLLMWMAWGYQKFQWKKEKGEDPTPPSISQAYLQTFLRLGFGIANMGNVLFGNTLCSSISFGILLGVLFSIFCVTHNLHVTLFDWKKDSGSAPLFYGLMIFLSVLIFVVILRTLNIKGFEMFALMGN